MNIGPDCRCAEILKRLYGGAFSAHCRTETGVTCQLLLQYCRYCWYSGDSLTYSPWPVHYHIV